MQRWLVYHPAIDYLEKIGMNNIQQHEHDLMRYAFDRLSKIQGITIIGKELENRGGVIAFTVDGIHPHDVAQILDSDGIAVSSRTPLCHAASRKISTCRRRHGRVFISITLKMKLTRWLFLFIEFKKCSTR